MQIVSSGAIPVLVRMIKEAKCEEEQIAAINVLWVLAFDQEGREDIRKNDECMEKLHNLKCSQNQNIKSVARGALWEIEGKQDMLSNDGYGNAQRRAAANVAPLDQVVRGQKKKTKKKTSEPIRGDVEISKLMLRHIKISIQASKNK